MITAILGLPGAGKTYRMVDLMLQRLCRGEDVATNLVLSPNDMRVYARKRRCACTDPHRLVHSIADYSDILNYVGMPLYLDEAHIWFSSRDYKRLPPELYAYWSQHRKMGVDVWLTSQRWGAVDVHIRSLTAAVELAVPPAIHMQALARLLGRRVLAYAMHYDVDAIVDVTGDSRASVGRVRRRHVWLDPYVARAYSTAWPQVPPYASSLSDSFSWRPPPPGWRLVSWSEPTDAPPVPSS